MVTLLVFLLILSLLVLIHEFGHFLMARRFNIKVEEFGFGFPPRLWGKKIGETIYSINWLPIGGFVKLFGEDEAGWGKISGIREQVSSIKKSIKREKIPDAHLKRAFFARPVWERASVVVAGVVMNAILAAVIFYVFLVLSGFTTKLPLWTNYNFFMVDQKNVLDSLIITGVSKGSPADEVGLKPCSKDYCLQLVTINGKKPTSIEEFRSIIKSQTEKETTFVWENLPKKQRITTKITPRSNPPKGQGAIGIRFNTQESAVLTYASPMQKILSGIVHPINLMGYQINLLARIISVSFEQRSIEPVGSAFSGPVGVFVVTAEVLKIPDMKERILSVLNLAGILSATLAVFNILPIPALDGGRLFFIIIEGLTGRKLNQRIETLINSIGMAFLITLILLVTFNDIFRFIIKR
jgi:regulator of sigma E protease